MKKVFIIVFLILIGVLLGSVVFQKDDFNKKLEYGKTGLPKNCRAIIKANIDGYINGEYTADGALGSINRNCGESGYAWEK